MRSVKLLFRLCVISLIFFSLQGEVISRWVTSFGHHTSVDAKQLKQEKLVKLQCYTQKFDVVALPARFNAFGFAVFRSCYTLNYLNPKPGNVILRRIHSFTQRGPPVNS